MGPFSDARWLLNLCNEETKEETILNPNKTGTKVYS